MDERKERIREHQQAVDQLDFSIKRQTAELGKLLLQLESFEEEELKRLWEEGGKLQEQIQQLETSREEIKEKLANRRELDERIEELENEHAEFVKYRSNLVQEIGKKAYGVYRSGTLSAEEFGHIFSEVDNEHKTIEDKEREIREQEEQRQQGGFVKKLPAAARITLLRNGIAKVRKRQEDAFSRAGEALLSSGKIEQIPEESVTKLTAQLKEYEDREEERDKEIEEAYGRREELNNRLSELCGGDPPEKVIKNSDDEISRLQEELDAAASRLGEAYLLQPQLREQAEGELRTVLDRLDDLEKQKSSHQDEIHTLQTRLEMDELQDKIRKKEYRISTLEKRVAEDKEKIEKLKDEISGDTRRLEELRNTLK
jgi:chromosome segregation ATPase